MSMHSPNGVLGVLIDGYDYISRRCDRTGDDIFQTRLLGKPVTCLRGAEAGRLFYDETRFARAGVAPRRARRTLFGEGGVQGLDDDAHRHRKAMFLSLMTPDAVADLAERTRTGWNTAIDRWQAATQPIALFDEAAQVLCRAVCDWASVPLPEEDLPLRTSQFHHLIDSGPRIGARHWQGRIARRQLDRWAAGLIDDVRCGALDAPEGAALHTIATHLDEHGSLLDARGAAVELINVLRPTVAIDRFIVFAAVALHAHPVWREPLRTDDTAVQWFVQEVRRSYPFFPATAARVRRSFDWNGHHFPRGRLVVLDLHGTDHHPHLWSDPTTFQPQRFESWDQDAFALVPQGGGDHATGHRCPGEWITIAAMKVAVETFTRAVDYTVPPQDLRISRRRIPTLPKSRFLITDVARRS